MKSSKLSLTLFIMLCGIVTFIACSKYKDSDTNTNDLPKDNVVTASVQGRVLDENGQPAAGVAVSSGVADTTTDANGVFVFRNIKVSSRFGYVRAVKAGYFAGSRSVVTTSGGNTYVTIQLIPRVSKGQFPASSPGRVPVRAGDTVSFTGVSFVVEASKAAYTGNVHVYAAYLDPTDEHLPAIMPGDLRGIGADGKETGLQSFGMLAVELEGDAGEKLQLAAGSKKAVLSMGIPAGLQAGAPATIPLWYFDEAGGKWMEEGKAGRVGNGYVGEVAHFTFWNCDLASGVVNFKLRLKDQNGNALAYTSIQFSSASFGTRGGYTDSAGYAQGMIPKGEAMLFQVLSPCKTVLFGEQIGPVLTDQDLGTMTVTYQPGAVTLKGSVTDCNGKAVADGYVNALIEGLNYRAVVKEGSFALTVSRCVTTETTVKIAAVDNGTGQQGALSTVSVSSGTKDIGVLAACGTAAQETVTFTMMGKTYSILAPPDSTIIQKRDTMYTFGAWTKNSSATFITEMGNLTKPGTYVLHWLVLDNGTQYNSLPNKEVCTVTRVDDTYGYIEGSFSATVYATGDSLLGSPHPATGSFKIKRTY